MSAIDRSLAALAAIPKPQPVPMARIILEVPLSDLNFDDQGEDFPLVHYYGTPAEVEDSSMAAVQDYFDNKRWEK